MMPGMFGYYRKGEYGSHRGAYAQNKIRETRRKERQEREFAEARKAKGWPPA